MDLMREIIGRALAEEEFTFFDLHAGLPGEADRLADRTLQSWRRKGFASYERRGRQCVWKLTANGQEALSAMLAAREAAK